ncbi:hypothetical protein ACFPYI_00455 [Halomarina salina]|uniref:CARDB domain-containing protein n=1 Tax=Halomarina salina TaxID=1872699 RepID=A0ABD5RHN1_9EURY|nr:hypothetical protein [Halomarina salina]
MQRRRYLAVCGTAAAGLLAGCNQTGGSSPGNNETVEGEAQFNNIIINAPQQAPIGSEVTMTISARNFGGQTGTYEDRIVTSNGDTDFAQDISITDVQSGQTGEVEVNAPVNGAGEYRFTLEEAEVSATVNVTAEAVEIGKMVDVGNNLQLTFTDASFRGGVYYRYVDNVGWTTDMFAPGESGRTLAVFKGKMKNTGSQETVIRPERFSVTEGTVFNNLDGKPLSTVESVEGQSLIGSPIKGGQTVEGWVLASVPKNQVQQNGVGVGWSLNAQGGGPDRVWSFPPRALPTWQQLEFRLSDRPDNGQITGEITVRNAGQVESTFYGLAEFHYQGVGWVPAAYPSGTVAPGATKTFTFDYGWPYIQQMEWRIQPFPDTRRMVEAGPLTLDYGQETYGIDESTVTVSNPRFMQRYSYSATQSSGGENNQVTKQREASGGKKFLFVDVKATVGKEGGQVPLPDSFVVKAGESNIKPFVGPTPTNPDVSFYSGANGGKQGDTSTGVLVFEVPSSVSRPAVNYHEEFRELTSDITWN